MTQKNAKYQVKNATGTYDQMMFETLSNQVKMASGANLETRYEISYYVAQTGLDTNDGLSPSSPFKTINQALKTIPSAVNHDVVVNVGVGNYSEDVVLEGHFGGGEIKIIGEGLADVIINSFFDSSNARVSISGISTFSAPNTLQYSFAKVRPGYLSIDDCKSEEPRGESVGVYCSTGAVIYITNSEITHKTKAFYATLGGKIILGPGNRGHNNDVVCVADTGGEIVIPTSVYTKPEGDAPAKLELGGRIIEGAYDVMEYGSCTNSSAQALPAGVNTTIMLNTTGALGRPHTSLSGNSLIINDQGYYMIIARGVVGVPTGKASILYVYRNGTMVWVDKQGDVMSTGTNYHTLITFVNAVPGDKLSMTVQQTGATAGTFSANGSIVAIKMS